MRYYYSFKHYSELCGIVTPTTANQSLDIRSWEAAASAAVQRALVIIDSTGVLSPADRANRGSGALPLHPVPSSLPHPISSRLCVCLPPQVRRRLQRASPSIRSPWTASSTSSATPHRDRQCLPLRPRMPLPHASVVANVGGDE